MSKVLRRFGLLLSIIALFSLAACGDSDSDTATDDADGTTDEEIAFPEKDISGIIQWGEGGATDLISRSLASIAEDELGVSLVMENITGATGAIGAQHVYDQPSDGHTLLFGAENPNLYQLLEISERDYVNDFVPISIIGQSYAGVVVKADSEFDTLEDVVEYAQENPDKLKMGTSGEGGLPHVASAMLKSQLDTSFNLIPYDGDGPLSVALLGGEIDITVLAVSAAQEYVESGDFKMLTVLHNEALDSLPEVDPITEIYPEFDQYMPWGPFQGIFAHIDTPDEVIEILSDAFEEAQKDEEFIENMNNLGVDPQNLRGEEAQEFVENNQSTSTWMLYEAGETDISPEDLGIPRIDE